MKQDEPESSHLLFYQMDDGRHRIEVRLQNETVWLSLNELSDLFQIDKSGVSRHLKNIFDTGELKKEVCVTTFTKVQQEQERAVTRVVEHYNLEAIIALGYRVNTARGTQFRQWATDRLKEYIVKGFTLDDERLKQAGGGSYFSELLARIRDIRSSEKVFWRKVLDIYATSIDYNPNADLSQEFFRVVQNKMHWAAHGHTAAEIIYGRADAGKAHMGLTSWSGSSVRKADVSVAKNYLSEQELDVLNRLVNVYLEFAELQAVSRIPMYMRDWIVKLDDFLRLSGRDILTHAGKVDHDTAEKKAHAEYDKFHHHQLNAPSAVEKHFLDAEKRVKQISTGK